MLRLPAFLSRIASTYDALPHTPHDITVVSAYDAFKRALLLQYRTISYRVIFTDTDPYPDSASMFREVSHTNLLRVYTGSDLPTEHPMNEVAGTLMTGRGIASRATYNHIFRAVHDALVHIPYRLSFGPTGEFKAFQRHASLMSEFPHASCSFVSADTAVTVSECNTIRALATETLAQNAWFNMLGNKQTFAPQKACLLPDSLIIEALELQI